MEYIKPISDLAIIAIIFVIGLLIGYMHGRSLKNDIQTAVDKLNTLIALKESLVKQLGQNMSIDLAKQYQDLILKTDTELQNALDEIGMLKSKALIKYQAFKKDIKDGIQDAKKELDKINGKVA